MFKALVFTVVIAAASHAFAYSKDTHKYETEIMLLHAGIDPAVAEQLSNYAQTVDDITIESALMPIPIVHMRVSRLRHFPTEGFDPFEFPLQHIAEQIHISGEGHGNITNVGNVAERDSHIANEMFNHALKTGNKYLIGTALHVLMDSYAHEGFEYIIGHGERGHFPDRPWMFVEKHNQMRKLLFQAMVRIRESLPEGGLSDMQINNLGKKNRELTAAELYQSYVEIPLVKKATLEIPHNDPLYTGEAINFALESLMKSGVAKAQLKQFVFNDLRSLFFEIQPNGLRRGAWDIMREIIREIYALDPADQARIIDLPLLEEMYAAIPREGVTLKGTNGTVHITAEELKSETGVDVVNEVTKKLLLRLVPIPALGDDDSQAGSKDTFEDEKLVEREDRLKRTYWQEVKYRVYGLMPTLMTVDTGSSKFKKWIKGDVGVDGAKLEADLAALDKNMENNQLTTSVSAKERRAFMWANVKYSIIEFLAFRITKPLVRMKILKEARGNLRLLNRDVPDAKAWKSKRLFDRLREAGVFKNIYSEKDLAETKAAYASRVEAVESHRRAMDEGKKLTPLGQVEALRGEFMSRYSLKLCQDIFTSRK